MSDRPPRRLVLSSRLSFALLALSACSGEGPTVERVVPEGEEPPTVVTAADPDTRTVTERVAPGVPVEEIEAPASGCQLATPVAVWPRPGWVDIVADDERFVIAGSSARGEDEEDVFVVSLGVGAAPEIIAQAALEHGVSDARRRAAPGLVAHGGDGLIALVDGEQRVLVSRLGTLSLSARGEHASMRFGPALGFNDGRYALAFTEEHEGEPLRIRAAELSAVGERRGELADLTPAGGGGAAPVFLPASTELVFVDPRSGVSVVHRSRLAAGQFEDVSVARPVNLVAEPPELAAVRIGEHEFLGYTAIGSVATTAVGMVRLDQTDPAVPIVPGTGYGVLHVDVAPWGDGALFVADVPTASAAGAPRRLHLRRLSADGELSTPEAIPDGDGEASRGRIAVAPSGRIAITYSTPDGVHVAIGRCAAR